jgi:hypothetical protein
VSKIREKAALLLGLGIVLFMPPVALIFAKPHMLWGIPLPVLYIFVLWLALIGGVRFVSKRLPPGSTD